MLGLIAPRRCHGCDDIIEEQAPVYCAADFDGLQKERETEVKEALGRLKASVAEVMAQRERTVMFAKRLTELMEVARTSLPFLRSAHMVACSMYEYTNGVLPRKTTGTCDCGTAARAAAIQDVLDATPKLLALSPEAQQAAKRLADV